MDFQTMVYNIEKYLKAKGDEYGVAYIDEMYNQMSQEEEAYFAQTYEPTEQELWEANQMEEEQETHWYTDQPITTNTRYWKPIKNGKDEYALVERDQEGNLHFLDFHTT